MPGLRPATLWKRDSGTIAFLLILQNFWEHLWVAMKGTINCLCRWGSCKYDGIVRKKDLCWLNLVKC